MMSGRLLVCLQQLQWCLRPHRWLGDPARARGRHGRAGGGAGTLRHHASLLGTTSPRVARALPRLAGVLLRRGRTSPGGAKLLVGRRDATPHPAPRLATRRARGHAPRGGTRHERTGLPRVFPRIRGCKQKGRMSPPAGFSLKSSGAATRLRFWPSPQPWGARGMRLPLVRPPWIPNELASSHRGKFSFRLHLPASFVLSASLC